ncbi:MAG: hypothetical protein WBC85_00480 [Planktotalea sp.]|uniref:hypothetical protein n=1 Tax=Planktotalea sp. TaxID=2029877 RepID=UPI003C724C66
MTRRTRRKHAEARQVHLTLRTPFAPTLEAAVARLYEVCGVRNVSRHLQVCLCPCCMSEEMRQSIIAAPNAELSEAQIREYSNSAHGTVDFADDLIALLPRYAELLAQDMSVDYNDSDEILWRFGAALKNGGMPEPVQEAYVAWGRAYFRHAAYAEARDLDTALFAYGAMKLLLSGGFSAPEVTALLHEAVLCKETGPWSTSWLCTHLFLSRRAVAEAPKLGFIWTSGLQDGAPEKVLDWFKGPEFHAALEQAMLFDLPDERLVVCYDVHEWLAANRKSN